MSSLAAGARLGPYVVTEALGAGGMGEVYRARDTRLERDVAIKVLPAQLASDTDGARGSSAKQGGRSAVASEHPGDSRRRDARGHRLRRHGAAGRRDARERLEAGPMPPRKAVEIGVQIANGTRRRARRKESFIAI